METKFIVESRSHRFYGKEYEVENCPLLQFGVLVHGPWGSLRVTDISLSLNHDKPKQTIFLGLVNIHAQR